MVRLYERLPLEEVPNIVRLINEYCDFASQYRGYISVKDLAPLLGVRERTLNSLDKPRTIGGHVSRKAALKEVERRAPNWRAYMNNQEER